MAQNWSLVKTVSIPAGITAFSADKSGNLFVASARGEIIKFDSQLELIISNSIPNRNAVDLIEARNALTPVTFSRLNQEILVFDRFLANPVQYDIRQFSSRYIWLMAPGPDQDFWFLENDPPTLVKFNRQTRTETIRAQLQTKFQLENIQYLKVENNYVLLVDAEFGIYVFDLFGNKILHFEISGAVHAHIYGDSLLTIVGQDLIEYNLQNSEQKSLQAPLGTKSVLRTDTGYLFLTANSLSIYQLN